MAINVVTGKGNAPTKISLAPQEAVDFKSWFDLLVAQKMEIDEALAKSYRDAFPFYLEAAAIAKAYMTTSNEPFTPLQPTQGEYGVKELNAQDIGAIVWSGGNGVSSVHSWLQTISLTASVSWANLFGTPGSPVTPSNTASYHSLLAWHGMISYQPGTRMTQLQQNVGSYTYPVTGVEQAAKIDKTFKKFKLIPLEGNFLLIPTNTWYAMANFQKNVFANAESYTEEIGLLGLVFGEYSYLKAQIS
jgi:hypothetical protein